MTKLTSNQLEVQRSSEPWYTLPKAAEQLNIPTSTLRRAAKEGLIPVHRPFNLRVRVRLSEVKTAIDGVQKGGH